MASTKLSQTLLPLILVLSSTGLIPHVQAANDWSQPCFSGVCSYDLPATPDGASGTLKIWGAETAIADITQAAGWEILSCDPQSLAQDLRIVCKTSDSSDGCAKLFASPNAGAAGAARRAAASSSPSASASAAEASGTALPSDGTEEGAVGKVVRLPQSCGKSAFARISKAWIPTDQSIPPSVARRLVRRDGETPQVKAITVDVDFGADSDARHGPVGFAIVGANFPGAAAKGDLDTSSIGVNNSASARRSFSRIYAQRGFTDFVTDAVDSVTSLNDFDVDKSTTLKPFDVDKTFNLIDQQIKCTAPAPVAGLNSSVGVSGKIKVDVDAKVHAVVSLGVVASGTVIPPKVEDFGITSGMTANVDSTIIMSAGVGGTLDSGKIKLFEVGVPGLDFPGVLSIGPTFQINAQAKASLDLDVDMTVGVKYNIDKAEFTFPKGGSKGGSFTPGDTPLKLSVQPSGTATGTIEAHLIPSLNLGIDALGGTVGAGVFVNLDAVAKATLGVGATGDKKDITINPRASPDFDIQAISKGIGRLGYPAAGIRGRGLIGETYFKKRVPQPFGFGDIVDGVKGAAKDVGSAIGDAASSAGDAIGDAASAVKDKAGDVVDDITGKDDSPATTTAIAVDAVSPSKTVAPEKSETATTSKAPEKETKTAEAPKPSATEGAGDSADAGFGGCLKMDAGLSVNVGATANFFGLFSPSTTLPLFSKDFPLFKKCFGDSTQVERRNEGGSGRVVRDSTSTVGKRAFDLTCNGINVGKATQLVNDVVAASKLA